MNNMLRGITSPLDVSSIGTVNSLRTAAPFTTQNIYGLNSYMVGQPLGLSTIGSYNSLYGMGGMPMGGMGMGGVPMGAVGGAVVGAMAMNAMSGMANPDAAPVSNPGNMMPGNNMGPSLGGAPVGQPAYSSGASQPAYSSGVGQPAYSSGASQPAYSSSASQPAYSSGVGQPAYSSGVGQPAYSSGVGQPAYSSGVGQPAAPMAQPAAPMAQPAAPMAQPAAPMAQPAAPMAPPVQKPVPPLENTVRKGQKVSLETLGKPVNVSARLGWNSTNANCDVDVSAFLLDNTGKVIGDTWFVFYGQEQSPDGSTVFSMDDGADRERITMDLSKLNPSVSKIVFVLTINEAFQKNLNFSMLKDAYVRIMDDTQNKEIVSFVMDEYYSNVTSMMIGEMYLHNGQWKFNAIGNGVAKDLSGLCELYGVQVV